MAFIATTVALVFNQQNGVIHGHKVRKMRSLRLCLARF